MNTPLLNHTHTIQLEHVSCDINNTQVLHDISVLLNKRNATALLGPNGSGKSTFLKALSGHPDIQMSGHTHLIQDSGTQLLQNYSAHERALNGMFTVWQHPPALFGLPLSSFLRTSLNAHLSWRGEQTLDPYDFLDLVRPALTRLQMSENWLQRSLDNTLSGGEKKKIELLQLILLKPAWVLCDEIEAGMDMETLKLTADVLTEYSTQGGGLLVVSHHPLFLDSLPIQRVIALKDKTIVADEQGENISHIWHRGVSSWVNEL